MSASKYSLSPERTVTRGLGSMEIPATKRLRGDPPVKLDVDPDLGRVYVTVGDRSTFVPIKRARGAFAAASEALAETIEDRDGE